ncbi:glycosyltransferase [Saccharicrinis sp. GN24d3]|uniref:glycosyltransferase n=1 Tax=Saccharicrinis sp. GN24d3 TaxID=3458416 RepID=UPI0040362200
MNKLVSVIVVTYNSSRFVEETLNSISAQTWPEIELIVTDDGSGDDTVEVCKKWIDANKKRFSRALVVETEYNTGVSANANRGLKEASGEWLCLPAGDDTLKPDCIRDNVHWVNKNNDIKVLFSITDVYLDEIKDETYVKSTPSGDIEPNSIVAPERTAESQYKMLLISDRIHFTPSLFINTKVLRSVGGFDERFKLLEDYPLWLNLTKNGHKLHFMDKRTVNYRTHANAINNTGSSFHVNPNYFKLEGFRRIYTYPNLPLDIMLYQRFYWMGAQIFRNNRINRSKGTGFLLNLLAVYLNPFKYYIWIKLRLVKGLRRSELYT